MTALVRAEVRRFLYRRLFAVLAAIVVGFIVLIGVWIFLRTSGFGYPGAVEVAIRIAAQPLFSLSVVVGASFVGAEWGSGAMTTLLTWEPRRGRVLASKLAAAVGVVGVATLLLLLLIALVLLPSGVVHGSMAGMTADWWWSTSGLWLRAGALSALGAGLGVGLAGLMRNSAGPVASWLVFEFVVSQLIVIWRPGLFRWLPGANVQQFLGGDEVFGATVNGQAIFAFSAVRAGVVLAAYAAAVLAASYASFRSRDVT